MCLGGTRRGNTVDTIIPVQINIFPKDQKNLMKFLEPMRKSKVIHTDNSLESQEPRVEDVLAEWYFMQKFLVT